MDIQNYYDIMTRNMHGSYC